MIEPNFDDDEREERHFLRNAIIRTMIGFLLFCVLIGVLFYAPGAKSAPIAQADAGDIRVTLTDEACALDAVTNLKLRVTWLEKGKLTEGCFGVGNGIVTMYFADKTAVSVLADIFQRVQGV